MQTKYIQGKHYLSNKRQLNEKPKIHQDGIIRLHGRFINTDLQEDAKVLILLPRQRHFSELLIQDIYIIRFITVGFANTCTTKAEVMDTTRTTCSRDDTQNMSDLSTVSRRHYIKPMVPWPTIKFIRSKGFSKTDLD